MPIDPERFERIAKALADPRRFQILEKIANCREVGCQRLCEQFPVAQQGTGLSYQVPSGWDRATQPNTGLVSLTPRGLPFRRVVKVNIPPPEQFSGTAAQVQNAFGTSIRKFVVNGKNHWANATDPTIPAALWPGVHERMNWRLVSLGSMRICSKPASHSIASNSSTLAAPYFDFVS